MPARRNRQAKGSRQISFTAKIADLSDTDLPRAVDRADLASADEERSHGREKLVITGKQAVVSVEVRQPVALQRLRTGLEDYLSLLSQPLRHLWGAEL